MRLLLVIALIFAPTACGYAGSAGLDGCTNPDAIAMALAKLHEADWRDVSLDQLRSIWPTELDGKDCDPGGCRDVWSEDRIISGHCQCCATFMFKTQGSEAMPRTEWLDNVVINYSMQRRVELVAVAKTFAAALGLRQTDLETIGRDPVQIFHWETTGRQGRELSGIELLLTDEGTRWELYLNSGQNITE
jgi:hypothetical protein